MDDIRERTIRILTQVLQDKTNVHEFFDSNNNIQDIGISSLQFIQMIVYLEQEFDIEFDDDISLDAFYDLSYLLTYLEKKIQGEG